MDEFVVKAAPHALIVKLFVIQDFDNEQMIPKLKLKSNLAIF